MVLMARREGPVFPMIPSQRRRRRMSVALAVGGGLLGVVSSHRSGTHAVSGVHGATRVGRCSLVALAGLIVAVTLVCGLGGVSPSVAAAAVPTYAWATRGGGPGSDFARGVSALADGSSIITGSFRGIATFGTTTPLASVGSDDTFTAKVNADGTYAWATRGGGTSGDYALGVSALADGSSIITGNFAGAATFGATSPLASVGSNDTFTAKVNADGTYAWATRGGGPNPDFARGVSALADGSSIITGSFRGIASFGDTSLTSDGLFDTFTAKVNADGIFVWAIQGGGMGGDVARGVSALADGSSIITGLFTGAASFGDTSFTSSGGSYDTFTAKVNADGTYVWATRGGGTGDDSALGVSALADGSSIITGYFSGDATFGSTSLTSSVGSDDTFTAKVNADGTYAWATKGGGPSGDYARGVSALADGSSIITGSFAGAATFGDTSLTSDGSNDTFTAKVNADGTYAWATRDGGPNPDFARGVSALADGSSIITGSFAGTATFGSTPLLTSAGSDDTFTARIVADAHQAPTGASASNAVTPVNTFKMKLLKRSARFITTQLNLPGPGNVVQVGTTRLPTPRATEMAKKAGTMIVCRARKTVTKAGKVTIICRLTAKALAARKKHALKVRLVTTFTPTGGTAFSVSRTLVLKKIR